MSYRNLVTVTVLGLLLTGCQHTTDSVIDPPEPASIDDSPSGTLDESPAPEPADAQEDAPESLELRSCDDTVKAAIDQTIGAQTQAFREGDFDAAYALASPSFQKAMPIDVFSTLIRMSYPQLLTADNARSGSCEVNSSDSVATILVRFDTATDPTYTLRYIVEFVEGNWRIAGANQENIPDTIA